MSVKQPCQGECEPKITFLLIPYSISANRFLQMLKVHSVPFCVWYRLRGSERQRGGVKAFVAHHHRLVCPKAHRSHGAQLFCRPENEPFVDSFKWMCPYLISPLRHEENHLSKHGWCKFMALMRILLPSLLPFLSEAPGDLWRITQRRPSHFPLGRLSAVDCFLPAIKTRTQLFFLQTESVVDCFTPTNPSVFLAFI